MIRYGGAAVAAVAVLLGASAPATAQTLAPGAGHQGWLVSLGAGLFGGASAGDTSADLRTRDGGSFPLFRATSRVGHAPEIEARVGYAFTPRYLVEARVAFSRPRLQTAISDDTEGAPDVELSEQFDQYVIDATLVMMLDRWRVWGLTPFAAGGGGYLRQLHEGQMLVETGGIFHAGGGVRRWLTVRDDGWLEGVGVRGDARVNLLSEGISLSGDVRAHASATMSVVLAF